MRTLVNDEIDVPADFVSELHFPTVHLRLRDVNHNRMLLEQKWAWRGVEGVKDVWVPVPFVAVDADVSPDMEGKE